MSAKSASSKTKFAAPSLDQALNPEQALFKGERLAEISAFSKTYEKRISDQLVQMQLPPKRLLFAFTKREGFHFSVQNKRGSDIDGQ